VETTGNQYARSDWRKLLSTRRGTVLVATVCALVAAGVLVVAMQQYRHNVNSESNPETVLVASGLIQKGTAGDAVAGGQLFKPSSIAKRQVSGGAIADTAQLRGKVAAHDIYPGQQLTASDFTTGGGLAGQLAPDQRAMSIPLDSSHGMLGQLHDGDHVDVYADLNTEIGGRNVPVLRLLMQNIQVLRAGTTSGGGGLSGSNPQNEQGNVTLQVPASQAGVLAYAAGGSGNKVWLVLRPANATPVSAPSATTAQSLLAGGTK
jgi:Flp pilus assembly protein CpaB